MRQAAMLAFGAAVTAPAEPSSAASSDVTASTGPAQPPPAPKTGNGTSSTPAPPGSTDPQVLVITEADIGKTFTLVPSTRAVLRLSNRYVWTPPQVDGTAVRLTATSYFRDPGYQEWQISITGQGEVSIRSSGTPNCAPGSTCPEAGLQFAIRITVTVLT